MEKEKCENCGEENPKENFSCRNCAFPVYV
jgi:hypothetical protein